MIQEEPLLVKSWGVVMISLAGILFTVGIAEAVADWAIDQTVASLCLATIILALGGIFVYYLETEPKERR